MTTTLRPSSLAAAMLLAGCATLQSGGTPQPSAFVRPLTRIDDASGAVRAAAVAAQRRARDCDSLAIAQARRGDLAAARRLLVEAIELAPGQASLYNNLGYVLLLAGDTDAAVGALRQALRIDPADGRAAANLDVASQALARAAPRHAPGPELRLVASSPGVYVLRHVQAPQPVADAQASRAAAAAVPAPVAPVAPLASGTPIAAATLEVSNGNGVTGMARRVAQRLEREGLAVRRLTNSTPYTHPVTRIEYRAGWQPAALRLRAVLPGAAALVESNDLRRGIDLKLLLGRDARRG